MKFGPWKHNSESRTIYYIPSGTVKKVESGEIVIEGRDELGSLVLASTQRSYRPTSAWKMPSHSAPEWGTGIVRALVPGRKFPFPKSLYAVEDTIRFFVKDKPNATVLDFFSGSGTTAHAVMRLNKQDGGNRRSISVTNNEVSADEQVNLRKQGLRPGDPDWEKWGICDYVTKPRIQAAITGQTPHGDPIKGDYKFTDEFPMSDGLQANARFFTLTYQPQSRVRHGLAFKDIAPMLWLRAGQVGRVIESIPAQGWDVAESYGVIRSVAASEQFISAARKESGMTTVYVVTDDDLVFSSMAQELSTLGVDIVRLYSTYLNNFAFQQGRETF